MTTKVKVLGWARYIGKQGTMFRNEVEALGGGAPDGITMSRNNWIAVADEHAAAIFRHLAETKNWVPDRRDRSIPDPPETLMPSEWEWCPNDGKQPKDLPTNIVAVAKGFSPKPVGETGFWSKVGGKIGKDKGMPAGTHGGATFSVEV